MKHVLAFFGAFNPPTAAHLALAQYAMEQTGREGVLFVPSKSVYIKEAQGKDFAYGEEERLEMLRLTARLRPWMQVVDWEIRADRQPRTYRTLTHLREEGYEPVLLFGSDKLAELEREWMHVEEICREFGIVCMARGEDSCRSFIEADPYLQTLAPWIRVLDTPAEFRHISSTQVRRQVTRLRELQKGRTDAGDDPLRTLQTENSLRDLQEELSRMVPEEILPQLMPKRLD